MAVCSRRVGTEEREVEACPRWVETEEKVVRGRAQAVVLKLEDKAVAQEDPRGRRRGRALFKTGQ